MNQRGGQGLARHRSVLIYMKLNPQIDFQLKSLFHNLINYPKMSL